MSKQIASSLRKLAADKTLAEVSALIKQSSLPLKVEGAHGEYWIHPTAPRFSQLEDAIIGLELGGNSWAVADSSEGGGDHTRAPREIEIVKRQISGLIQKGFKQNFKQIGQKLIEVNDLLMDHLGHGGARKAGFEGQWEERGDNRTSYMVDGKALGMIEKRWNHAGRYAYYVAWLNRTSAESRRLLLNPARKTSKDAIRDRTQDEFMKPESAKKAVLYALNPRSRPRPVSRLG